MNLSVSGLPAHNGKNYTIKVSGTFTGASTVSVFAMIERGTSPPACAANAYAESQRPLTQPAIGAHVTHSPFSFSATFTASHVGARRVCAYLDKGTNHDNNPPLASRSKYFYVSP